MFFFCFFFKQKTAYELRISDWSSDVCSSDLTVGKDGIVTVEEGQGLHLEKEVVEGFTFDRGFVSPYMVTDTSRMEAVYSKPAEIGRASCRERVCQYV